MSEIDRRLADRSVPEDIERIVLAALDLAYYRKMPIADDLASSVAFELQDRVSKLPEVRAL